METIKYETPLKTHYPVIQLLRAIAAGMICLYHLAYSLVKENTIAQKIVHHCNESIFLFFVISGFVISLSLAKQTFTIKDVPNYLKKRFIRIEIPYIATILLMLAMRWYLIQGTEIPMDFEWKQFVYHLFYWIPFSDYPWYNIIFWSLGIEFQFYFLILFIHFLLNKSNIYGQIAVLLLFSMTSFFVDHAHIVFHYSIIFAQGITLVYVLNQRINAKIGIALLSGMALGTAVVFSPLTAAFCAFGVLAIAFWKTDARWFRPFGDQSYSLYLLHGLSGGHFLYFILPYADNKLEKMLVFIGAIAFSYLVAYCFWRFIENPAQKLSKRRS